MKERISSRVGRTFALVSLGLSSLVGCGVSSSNPGGQQQDQNYNSPPQVVEGRSIPAGNYSGSFDCVLTDSVGTVVDSYNSSEYPDFFFSYYDGPSGRVTISENGFPVVVSRGVEAFAGYKYLGVPKNDVDSVLSALVTDVYQVSESGDVIVRWDAQYSFPNGGIDSLFTLQEDFINNQEGSISYKLVANGLSGNDAGMTESCEGTMTRR